jgi:two-component system sensor histidine kinase YesM
MRRFRKLLRGLAGYGNSMSGKITILFIMMFLLLLTPVVLQTYTAFRTARAYRDIIDGITYANRLNNDVNANIEPVVWNIVAGKVRFAESGVMPLAADIRERMSYIQSSARSPENKAVMEMALRTLGTLESYLERLNRQIAERYPVAENELLLEEIRVCVAGINDLLQVFSSAQAAEAAGLNEDMYSQSYQGLIVNILLMLATVIAAAFALIYIIRGVMEEQKQRQMLEYKVLQEQITPHFLYNALDAIIWAAEDADSESVIKLVTALSAFFRTSLSRGVDLVPVSSELEHVESYLTIQQIRYSDILTWEIQADEELKSLVIPKLLLQPLVENSIYHGIKNTRNRGRITVTVKKEDGMARFTVADNGAGMPEERAAELRRDIENQSREKGFGLFNVNRRLKLYYAKSAGVEIGTNQGSGLRVSFAIDLEGGGPGV